ncbi:hypothetical protein N9R79_01270 [Vibrio sp.]|nr:hypothetical protein [Vibrio sp.]
MTQPTEREVSIGGNIDTALNGQYTLSPVKVLQEAWGLTFKHFLSFLPANILLVVLQVAIVIIAMQLQGIDAAYIDNFLLSMQQEEANQGDAEQAIYFVNALMIANFSLEVITAPFFAGVSLMALSHSVGLKTKLLDITKGLQFTVAIIGATLLALVIQGIFGQLSSLISFYFTITLHQYYLLIADKKLPLTKALWVSFRAVNKKFFAIFILYMVIAFSFALGFFTYGAGFMFALPFSLHIKAIIYREMFGVRVKVLTYSDGDSGPSKKNESEVFDA